MSLPRHGCQWQVLALHPDDRAQLPPLYMGKVREPPPSPQNEETQTKTKTTESLNRQNSKVLSICREKETQTMVRVSSPAELRPWSELTAKMVMGVVPGLVNMGKVWSICHFFRALPASIWGHCFQVLVFTLAFGVHKKGWTLFVLLFSQHLGILGPPNTAKLMQTDKSTLFNPHLYPHSKYLLALESRPLATELSLHLPFTGSGNLPTWKVPEDKEKYKIPLSGPTPESEECQKPQPPLLLKKVSQYTSHLYCNTPPICTAVLLVPLRSEEWEILSVLLPFVSQYASHLYRNTFGKILVVVVTGLFPTEDRENVPKNYKNYPKKATLCNFSVFLPCFRVWEGSQF